MNNDVKNKRGKNRYWRTNTISKNFYTYELFNFNL